MSIRINTGCLRAACGLAGLAVCIQGLADGTATATTEEPQWSHKKSRYIEFVAKKGGTTAGLGTFPLANNAEGAVVGYYIDPDSVLYGFLRTPDGTITTLKAPGSGTTKGSFQGTDANAINDAGVITGNVEDDSNLYHGFVRWPDGHYDVFEVPGSGTQANQGTVPESINLEGTTLGYYVDSSNTLHGFVRQPDATVATFDPPGSVYTYPCQETCLNIEGEATGVFIDAGNVLHGFLRKRDGKITVFDGPGAGTGAGTGTFPASITPEGEITGYVIDSSGSAHGFVRYRDGSSTEFDVPVDIAGKDAQTIPFCINVFGDTTGEFIDSSGVMHGFIRSKHGYHVRALDAPGAGTKSGQGTRPSTNNWAGEVTGWYVDSIGAGHGFIWIPADE